MRTANKSRVVLCSAERSRKVSCSSSRLSRDVIVAHPCSIPCTSVRLRSSIDCLLMVGECVVRRQLAAWRIQLRATRSRQVGADDSTEWRR